MIQKYFRTAAEENCGASVKDFGDLNVWYLLGLQAAGCRCNPLPLIETDTKVICPTCKIETGILTPIVIGK